MAQLPEIPDSYFKLIQLLWMMALSLLAALGYQKATTVEANQVITHQKQDAAAVQLATAETKLTKVDEMADRIRMKVGANGGDK